MSEDFWLVTIWLFFWVLSVYLSYLLSKKYSECLDVFITSPLWGIFGILILPLALMVVICIVLIYTTKDVIDFYKKSIKEFRERP